MITNEQLAHGYFFLKNYVIKKGFGEEIDWQEDINFNNITEQVFMEELCWVILSSGMNEKIIRKIFPNIKKYLFEFNIDQIIIQKDTCFTNCLKIFNHSGKINAIIYAAEYIKKHSFRIVKEELRMSGIDYLLKFPYLGNATAYHFAKNIGMDVAKPDRHLLRIASALGYRNPHQLCTDISLSIDEKISLVDLVLWRYATLDKKYLDKIIWYKDKKSSNY